KKGMRLKAIPTLTSDWGFWLDHYPQAVAYHMFDKYKPVELPTTLNEDSRKSRRPADDRLPSDTEVLGVWTGKEAKAYPLADIAKAGLIEDRIGERRYYILWQPKTRTAAAYSMIVSGP